MKRLIAGWLLCLIITGLLVSCQNPDPPSPTATPTSSVHTILEELPIDNIPSSDAEPLWITPLGEAINVTPNVVGDLVVVATADGAIHALDAASGAPVWLYESDKPLWDASLRVAEGQVCAGLQGGLVTCLNAETAEPLWTVSIGLEMQSRPALVDGVLYAPTTFVGPGLENDYDGEAIFFALDAGTGEILWEVKTGNYILRRPTVAGDLVITGGAYLETEQEGETSAGRIYAFDKTTGEERWRYESDDGLLRWLVPTGDIVTFAGRSETVNALKLSSGDLVWSFGPSYWMQFPAETEDRLFLGTGDERFHAIMADSGQVIWEQQVALAELNQIGRPILRDNIIWFNTVGGDIYGLNMVDGSQVLHLVTEHTIRVGGALYQDLYIMGDSEGNLYAYSIQ